MKSPPEVKPTDCRHPSDHHEMEYEVNDIKGFTRKVSEPCGVIRWALWEMQGHQNVS